MSFVDPNTLDYGKYELSTSSKSLVLSGKALEQFELGIWLALYNWSVLDVAVQDGWGGPDSAEKRDWLAGQVAELFETYSSIGLDEISERLTQVMADEFDTVVEDDSELPVAIEIVEVYKQCQKNDYEHVAEVFKKYQEREALRAQGKLPKTKTEVLENSDGSSDEGEGEWEDDDKETPQLANAEPKEREGPIIDDDGFELVTKKGRGKR